MKIEKVNHFLTKVFVVALVITQVILFVAIQVAVKGSQQLPVQFISPIAGQEITIGQSIELEAVIDVGSYDFDVVYFVVESDEFDVSLQFQAINQGNNNWIADSSWQTDNYSVGDYQVSILAQIFDDNGVIIDTQESSAIIISLIEATLPLAAEFIAPDPNYTTEINGQYQVIIETNQVTDRSLLVVLEQDNQELDQEYFIESSTIRQYQAIIDTELAANDEAQLLVFIEEGGQRGQLAEAFVIITNQAVQTVVDPVAIEEIISPTAGEVIEGEHLIQVRLNLQLEDGQILQANLVQNNQDQGDFLNLTQLNDEPDDFIYQGLLDTTEYDNGQYQLTLWLNDGQRTELNNISITIDNEVAETTTPLTAEVIAPSNDNQELSGIYTVEVLLNRALQDEENLWMHLLGNTTSTSFVMSASNIIGQYQQNLDTSLYDNGQYQLAFRLQNQDINLATRQIIINSQSADQELLITLAEPEPNSVIDDEQFIVRWLTNQAAASLSFLLIKEDDPSIGSEYSIIRTNGTNWSKQVILGDDFINGQYIISAIVTGEDGTIYTEEANLILELPIEPDEPEEPDVPNEPEDDQATTTPPEMPPDAGDNDQATTTPPDEPELTSCQSDDQCINLCSGCYHTADVPNIDCAGLPFGDCICSENFCTRIAGEDEVETEEEGTDFIEPLCLEEGITDADDCQLWLAMINDNIESLCLAEQIYTAEACEDYLNRTFVDLECQAEQIIDPEECQNYLVEKYTATVACYLDDENLCQQILEEEYLNRLVIEQKTQEKITQVIRPLIGQTIEVMDLAERLIEENLVDILPLQFEESAQVLIAPAQAELALISPEKLAVASQAVLLVDTDQDGLSDDFEAYYGTDPINSDSDVDGYLDGEEVANNYNPLGPGDLTQTRIDLEKAISAGQPLEQPKLRTDKLDQDFQVIEASTQEESEQLILHGLASPNTWVTVYLYSDLPLVMTTRSDASGNWSYSLDNSLADGQHQVYVTINDDTGKIIKQSQPLSFLVRGAKAVSASDYFATAPEDKINSMLLYYLLGAGFLIVLALGVLIFIHRDKGENIEEV